jgi:hypothetical protein
MATIAYPPIFRVRQRFDAPRVDDVEGLVLAELTRLELQRVVLPGARVAVPVGSRGIARIDRIIKTIVDYFKSIGAEPFIIPAMGSHGGGTAEGQLEVIRSYGINETTMGCPILASMETVVVCETREAIPVHFDRHAFEADHVLVCNRIKPHTHFVGPLESGLMKMMLIGLGKRAGAEIYHRAIQQYSFLQIIRSVADEVRRRCKILAGLAIVENAYDQTALIEVVRPDDFERREAELLQLARRWMPRLPFSEVDVLLIDRIGKDKSGSGIDTNVVGRKFNAHAANDDEWPKVKRIVVRGLTEATHGNALGVGIAEFCKSRVLEQADLQATRLNGITAGHIELAMAALDYPTDREILDRALGTIGLIEPPEARLLWIDNTLELVELECSAAYLEEARQRDDLEVLTPPRPLPLDADGNLPDFDRWPAC